MNIKTIKKSNAPKVLSDVLAVDIGTSATKLVRLKKSKRHGISVCAVGTERAIDLRSPNGESPAFDFPRNFRARYASMSVSGKQILIRLISMPSNVVSQGNVENRVREQMHLDDNYRISHAMLRPPRAKADGEYIVVGIPDEQAKNVLSLLATGPVAPVALEASGLAALRAFDYSQGAKYREGAVAVVETGSDSLFMGIFSKGELALLRTFNFGESSLVKYVEDRLGITHDEALSMIGEGSFDVTDAVTTVMRPFFEQLGLSKDYIERRDGVRVKELCISGGMSMSKTLVNAMQLGTGMPVKAWNPFDRMNVETTAFPDELKGHESRFASAVGVALNAIGEDA